MKGFRGHLAVTVTGGLEEIVNPLGWCQHTGRGLAEQWSRRCRRQGSTQEEDGKRIESGADDRMLYFAERVGWGMC